MARVVQGEEDSDEELELSSSKGPTFSTATTSPTFSQTPQFGSAQATLSVALVKFGKDDEEDEPSQSVTAPSFGSASLGNVPEPTNSSRPTARSALIFEGEEEEEENYRADAAKQAPLTATAASDNQSTSSTKPQEPPRSAAERRLRDMNESLRKLQAKKIVGVFEACRKELGLISDSVNSGLRTLQDAWAGSTQLNEKMETLSKKVEQLPMPFRV